MTTYVIVPVVDVVQAMLNKSLEHSVEKLRTSTDGTLCVIETENPVHDVFIDYRWYSHSEIEVEMAKAEWN